MRGPWRKGCRGSIWKQPLYPRIRNITMRKYTAPLSLTALVCFMGTLQSIAVTFVMEHKPSVWTIGFDMNLLAAAYAGIVSSSIAYYVQGLVMEKRGPVFVTAFSPLMMIIVAIMGSFILAEKIYIGGILGAVLIVAGLYSVLWGKYKEYQEKEIEGSIIPEAVKGVNNQMMILADNEANNDIEMQKNSEGKRIQATSASVAISFPMPQAEADPGFEHDGAPQNLNGQFSCSSSQSLCI